MIKKGCSPLYVNLSGYIQSARSGLHQRPFIIFVFSPHRRNLLALDGQVLAVCAYNWDGACMLLLYYTSGLKLGEDIHQRFRRARLFEVGRYKHKQDSRGGGVDTSISHTPAGGGGGRAFK
jgi:hypothetical protein